MHRGKNEKNKKTSGEKRRFSPLVSFLGLFIHSPFLNY